MTLALVARALRHTIPNHAQTHLVLYIVAAQEGDFTVDNDGFLMERTDGVDVVILDLELDSRNLVWGW